MDMNEATAKALGAERQISGLTVRALAHASGIPERSLMRVLQAEREIKVNQVAQLAAALRLYPHEVIEHAESILARSDRPAPEGVVIDLDPAPRPAPAKQPDPPAPDRAQP